MFDAWTSRLTETASSFGRPELLQAIAEGQPDGARVADIERAANETVGKPFIVRLEDAPAPGGAVEPRYTTRDLVAIEQRLLQQAEACRGSNVGVAESGAVDRALVGRDLGPDQRAVVRDLCARGDGIAVVRAPAGAGKTYALDAAREAWQACGVSVTGCAMSARAALELHDQTAIEATTIAKLRKHLGRTLPSGGVLVVDEAGMVGTRQIAELADACNDKLHLVLRRRHRALPGAASTWAARFVGGTKSRRVGSCPYTDSRALTCSYGRCHPSGRSGAG